MVRFVAVVFSLALAGSLAAAPDYPTGDGDLVLEYDRYSLDLAERDPTPMLRIYGSGRVCIHRPAYLRQAGRFEVMLDPRDLDALLTRALAFSSLDSVALAAAIESAQEQERQRTGRLFYSSEATISTLRLVLPAAAQGEPLVAENVQLEARRFNDLPELRALAEFERELLALSERDDLVRVADSSSADALR